MAAVLTVALELEDAVASAAYSRSNVTFPSHLAPRASGEQMHELMKLAHDLVLTLQRHGHSPAELSAEDVGNAPWKELASALEQLRQANAKTRAAPDAGGGPVPSGSVVTAADDGPGGDSSDRQPPTHGPEGPANGHPDSDRPGASPPTESSGPAGHIFVSPFAPVADAQRGASDGMSASQLRSVRDGKDKTGAAERSTAAAPMRRSRRSCGRTRRCCGEWRRRWPAAP